MTFRRHEGFARVLPEDPGKDYDATGYWASRAAFPLFTERFAGELA